MNSLDAEDGSMSCRIVGIYNISKTIKLRLNSDFPPDRDGFSFSIIHYRPPWRQGTNDFSNIHGALMLFKLRWNSFSPRRNHCLSFMYNEIRWHPVAIQIYFLDLNPLCTNIIIYCKNIYCGNSYIIKRMPLFNVISTNTRLYSS